MFLKEKEKRFLSAKNIIIYYGEQKDLTHLYKNPKKFDFCFHWIGYQLTRRTSGNNHFSGKGYSTMDE